MEHTPEEEANQNGDRPHHPQAENRRTRRLRWWPNQGRGEPQPHGAVGERQARSRSETRERIKAASPEQPGIMLQHTTCETCSQQNHNTTTTLAATVPRHPQSMAKLVEQTATTTNNKRKQHQDNA